MLRRRCQSLSLSLRLCVPTQVLTPLGVHLASLPVDCRLGKLLLLGAVFGCADEALTIAATLSQRSPFLCPAERRAAADAAKLSFASHHRCGPKTLTPTNACTLLSVAL